MHADQHRNLVLLQKLELLLKGLILKGNLTLQSSPRDIKFPSLKEQVERQKGSFQKTTLGNLEKQFGQSCLNPLPELPANNGSKTQTSLVRFRMSCGTTEDGRATEYQDRFKEKLKLVTSGRNKLVHELFTSFDMSTDEGLADLDKFLEQQHKYLLSIVKEIEGIRESLLVSGKALSDALLNPKIPKDCDTVLCVTKFLVCLCLFESSNDKNGGFEWASLAAAKKYLNNLFPEAIPECRRHYNVMSLKNILSKIGIFDVQRLPTHHGEEMVFYRLKHEYSLGEDESGELYLCSKQGAESGGYLEEKTYLGMFLEK